MLKRRLILIGCALLCLLGVTVPVGPTASATEQPCADVAYQPPSETTPFAKLPFRKRDALGRLVITQGWEVSEDEEPFVGGPGLHRAIDFEFIHRHDKGFGVPVLAMAAGCAYWSFQHISGTYTDPQGVTHQVGWGAGLFVEIIHDNGWVTQYAHLDRVNPKLTYLRPEPNAQTPGDWVPVGIFTSSAELKKIGVRVQQGEVLGSNGDTGITLDYFDAFDVTTGLVAPRNRLAQPNWEGGNAQLHVAIYQGRNDAGTRQGNSDLLGIYGKITSTSDPYNRWPGQFFTGAGNLVKLWCGLMQYAG